MIHQYRHNGLDIILDVNSAAVHLVDEVTAGVVHVLTEEKESYGPGELLEQERVGRIASQMGDQAGAGEIREILEELDELIRQGRLFLTTRTRRSCRRSWPTRRWSKRSV